MTTPAGQTSRSGTAFNIVWCLLAVLLPPTSATRRYEVLAPVAPPNAGSDSMLLRQAIQAAWDRANPRQASSRTTMKLTLLDHKCANDLRDIITKRGQDPETYLILLGGNCPATSSTWSVEQPIPQILYRGQTEPWSPQGATLAVHGTWRHLCLAVVQLCRQASLVDVTVLSFVSQEYRQRSELLQRLLQDGGIDTVRLVHWTGSRVPPIASSTVVLVVPPASLPALLCRLGAWPSFTQHAWILPIESTVSFNFTSLSGCQPKRWQNVHILHYNFPFIQSQGFQRLVVAAKSSWPRPSPDALLDAAFATDATSWLRTALDTPLLANVSRGQFPEALLAIIAQARHGITGTNIKFMNGTRMFNITFSSINGDGLVDRSLWSGENFQPSVNQLLTATPDGSSGLVKEGIPLYLLVIICSLAIVGTVYAFTILAFNIYLRTDKIIKMTSPNLNVLILLGCVLVYTCAVPLGLDSYRVGSNSRGMLLQTATYMLACGFTMVYGTTLAKSFRVYLVFRNLNFNGKITRDEHLLLAVAAMVVLDLCVLLPWTFVDPIVCGHSNITTHIQDSPVGAGQQTEYCSSRLLLLWVLLLYAYKALVLVLAVYLTWKTRHVSLPALRDASQMYASIFTVGGLGLLGLPLVLMDALGPQLKYTLAMLMLTLGATTTITLLFLPKLFMYRQQRKAAENDTKLMFSESMRNTQAADRRCRWLFCCISQNGGDPYGQEMLTSEIEHLNRTIRQKEATIRELTDRLYFETEKSKGYFMSPKYQQYLERSQRVEGQGRGGVPEGGSPYGGADLSLQGRRPQSREDPALDGQSDSSQDLAHRYRYSPGMERAFKSPKLQRKTIPIIEGTCQTPQLTPCTDSYHDQFGTVRTQSDKGTRLSPSPNTDSAIDNGSVSTDSWERGSGTAESSALTTQPPKTQPELHRGYRSRTDAQSPDPHPEFVDPSKAVPWYSEGLDTCDEPNHNFIHGRSLCLRVQESQI